MEHCVGLIMAELRRRGISNHHTLAYQSRVGPVEWLQPYTDDAIRCEFKSQARTFFAFHPAGSPMFV